MTPEEFRRVREVFEEARVVFGPQRAMVLERVGAREHPIRAEVEALLAESELPTPMLDRSVVPEGTALRLAEEAAGASPGLFVGAMVGEFRVLRLIGAGSMGEVYEAEQEEPRRRIALKLVSTPVSTGELGRRLKQESAILARLQHPGVAQVFRAGCGGCDAGGEDGAGAPIWRWSWWRGAVPITLWAAEHGLDVGERVELLATVCDAVHHGHQRGVIHRDLKPANILVDGSGQPKVIDFGVARLAVPDSLGATGGGWPAPSATMQGQVVGTLAYMSPEQCAGDPDVDTRSDVYALGALLMELLSGQTPVDASQGESRDVRTLHERPRRRLAALRSELAGDLDTIVEKALARDRVDRYPSASQLADDLRRYLRHEPIVARPPTVLYQIRLLARRNRGLVGAVTGIAATLVVATAVSSAFAVHATREARAAEMARQAADRERAQAVKVATFLQGGAGVGKPISANATLEGDRGLGL